MRLCTSRDRKGAVVRTNNAWRNRRAPPRITTLGMAASLLFGNRSLTVAARKAKACEGEGADVRTNNAWRSLRWIWMRHGISDVRQCIRLTSRDRKGAVVRTNNAWRRRRARPRITTLGMARSLLFGNRSLTVAARKAKACEGEGAGVSTNNGWRSLRWIWMRHGVPDVCQYVCLTSRDREGAVVRTNNAWRNRRAPPRITLGMARSLLFGNRSLTVAARKTK